MLYYTKRGLLIVGTELFDTKIGVPEAPEELDHLWTQILSDLVIEDYIRTHDISDNEFLSGFDLQKELEEMFGGSLKANYSDLSDWVKEMWSAEYMRGFIRDLNRRWDN